jgi:hypothetical protein
MSASALAIPYEKQFDPSSTRTCGAACLSMIYRSFGQEVPQRLIWPLIAEKNRFGSIASTTHLMTADALTRGFYAVAIQARQPLQVLRLCRDSGIRAILNHRFKPDSPAGHYSVLVDIDSTHVTLHDPYFGPSRRLTHAEILDLWHPRVTNSEIVGNMLIGIAEEPLDAASCQTCQAALLPRVACPKCKNPTLLQPGVMLACMNNGCPERLWNYVCCPTCDLTWSFQVEPPLPGLAAAAAPILAQPASTAPPTPQASSAPPIPAAGLAGEDPLQLTRLFGEIEKFFNHILTLPAAAEHPDIKKYMATIAASKEKLTLAVAESSANLKLHDANLAALAQASKQRQEAHQKRLDALKQPLAPLNGDDLARALLKNLGFLT